MHKTKTNSNKSPTAIATLAAGLFSATASFALLQPDKIGPEITIAKDPIVEKTLKDAKSLQSLGKWQQSAELLALHAIPANPEATLEYAKLLSRGWGTVQNMDKAREKLLLAVQKEFPKRGQAAFELAKVYRQSPGEDCARIAFEWFTKAAAWGFSKAHVELGRHHQRGVAVPVDIKLALNEYQIAAREGSATALLSFLKLVAKKPKLGQTLPPISVLVSKAIPMLEQEALSGKAVSAKELGRLYSTDLLVPKNEDKAKIWFGRSVDLGDSGAMSELALLLLKGFPSEEEIARAIELMRHAIKLNNSGALTEFGRLHLDGNFGLKLEDAVGLFEQGVEAAHPGSMMELAKLYIEGQLVAKDKPKAIALLKRGSSLGHTGSKRLLAETRRANTTRKIVGNKIELMNWDRASGGKSKKIKKPPKKSNKSPLSGATVITTSGRKG